MSLEDSTNTDKLKSPETRKLVEDLFTGMKREEFLRKLLKSNPQLRPETRPPST